MRRGSRAWFEAGAVSKAYTHSCACPKEGLRSQLLRLIVAPGHRSTVAMPGLRLALYQKPTQKPMPQKKRPQITTAPPHRRSRAQIYRRSHVQPQAGVLVLEASRGCRASQHGGPLERPTGQGGPPLGRVQLQLLLLLVLLLCCAVGSQNGICGVLIGSAWDKVGHCDGVWSLCR